MGIRPSRMPGCLSLACAGAILASLVFAGALATASTARRPAASVVPARAGIASAPARMTFIAGATPPATGAEVMVAATNGGSPKPLGRASTAVLSPNGQFVAAVSPGSGTPPMGSTLVLYRLSQSPATSRRVRSSTGQITILAWSPDSRWIAALDGTSLVVIPLKGRARVIATGTINGASFAPTAPDRLVYSKATSLLVSATVNLYVVPLSGGRARQVTHDGLSEYPLWGPYGIVFSREASHTTTSYQLWQVRSNGHDLRALTNVTVTAPFYGLVPVAVSADGKHLLANLVGNAATEAYAVDLGAKPLAARSLGAPGATTIGNALSHDGRVILLTDGADSATPGDFSGQSVEVEPWSGGTPTVLAAHAAFASWNR